jgi:hypothetical protein
MDKEGWESDNYLIEDYLGEGKVILVIIISREGDAAV